MRPQDVWAARPRTTMWRFFPWFVAAAMLVVIAVNGGMVYAALHSFPGKAGDDGFDLSNHYNTVLDRVEQQASLGWTARAEMDATGHPVIVMTSRSGAALSGAGIEATAARPVGDPRVTRVSFTEVAPGRYLGQVALDEKGQWDLDLTAVAGGHDFIATRRVVVR